MRLQHVLALAAAVVPALASDRAAGTEAVMMFDVSLIVSSQRKISKEAFRYIESMAYVLRASVQLRLNVKAQKAAAATSSSLSIISILYRYLSSRTA